MLALNKLHVFWCTWMHVSQFESYLLSIRTVVLKVYKNPSKIESMNTFSCNWFSLVSTFSCLYFCRWESPHFSLSLKTLVASIKEYREMGLNVSFCCTFVLFLGLYFCWWVCIDVVGLFSWCCWGCVVVGSVELFARWWWCSILLCYWWWSYLQVTVGLPVAVVYQ